MKRAEIEAAFNRYGPMVYARALNILGNEDEARDVTQEVFIKAFLKAETFEARSRVSTWLYQITTNTCLNWIRDAGRQRALIDRHADRQAQTHTAPDAPEHRVVIRRLLERADERCAHAAIYVHIDGMSHAEASEVLGVSKRTIGNLLERFERFARSYLQAEAPAATAG